MTGAGNNAMGHSELSFAANGFRPISQSRRPKKGPPLIFTSLRGYVLIATLHMRIDDLNTRSLVHVPLLPILGSIVAEL
ncbi:hypothetical protein EVAR_63012_1 [Eumeta japonica]|uniref:Uncharacterized protein n=1 Tax=Eumeta variegata TaxID=151549 RepID=A0A4C1YUW5_EUMVA|nr:hypothetical protein EVAR_63012_1 [Eumeta japonica]